MQERTRVPGLEAVENGALALGSNGRGRGGVRGYMVAMASKKPKRFALLLEKALQLKNTQWGGGEAFLSTEQAVPQVEKKSFDEIVMDYVIHLVVPPLDDGPPSSATDLLEAVIDAARRHGSNGRGKDGVEGYIRMLAQIGCRTFDRWVIRAMVEKVKDKSPKSIDEVKERLRERGVEKAVYDIAFVMKCGRLPPENETPRSVTELLEGLRLGHQHFNFIRESREANPAGMAPEGHDHDDHRGTFEQQ